MKAMVLAAGVGSRLEPLTNQLPKPLVPVANRPVMELILALLNRHGVNEVISNVHYLPEKVQKYFGNGDSFNSKIQFHYEKELSGDAGGVRACRKQLEDGTFLVIMGDLLTDADLSSVVRQHKEKKALATIATKEVEDVSQFGVVVTNEDGFITGFQEKPKPSEAISNYASTGIYVLEPEIFEHIPKEGIYGFGKQLFPTLVEKNLPVLAAKITDYWSDVGTISQYRQSNFDVLSGRVLVKPKEKPVLWGFAGNDVSVSESASIEGKLIIGNNSRIGNNVRIKGSVIIGDNCQIDDNVELNNTIVWSGSKVEKNAKLSDCVVGENCNVPEGSYKEIASISWPPAVCKSIN